MNQDTKNTTVSREKLNLTKEEGRLVIWGDLEGYKVIDDKIDGKTRWSDVHYIVIQRESDGKFFADEYRTGSNENCDDRPYDYNEPDFTEVFPVEQTVIVYK